MRSIILTLSLIILFSGKSDAHSGPDSLWQIIKTTDSEDSIRRKQYGGVLMYYIFRNPDTASLYLKFMKQDVDKRGSKILLADYYNYMGINYAVNSIYDSSLQSFLKTVDIKLELKDTLGGAATKNNVANVYLHYGQYAQALETYYESLRLTEKYEDVDEMRTKLYFNITKVYNKLDDYSAARNMIEKYKREILDGDNLSVIGSMFNNIYANLLKGEGKYDSALYFLSLNLLEKTEVDFQSMAFSNAEAGEVLMLKGQFDSAEYHLTKSMEMFEKFGDKEGLAGSLFQRGMLEISKKSPVTARQYCEKGREIAESISSGPELQRNCRCLYEANRLLGNKAEALEWLERYNHLTDSLQDVQTAQRLAAAGLEFEFDKEQAILESEIKAQKKLANEERKRQYIITGSVSLILVLTIVFTIVIINRLRLTRKQKSIIESQNTELISSNEEIAAQRDNIEQQGIELRRQHDMILDSINYAKLIQDALLKSGFAGIEHAILFKPKDIVSGDFYWTYETERYLFAGVFDCTGHGVPGAFLTMLGTSFLNEICANRDDLNPAEILDILRIRIINELGQDGTEGSNRDGMDASLLRINKTGSTLDWAGANNPLWILKDGELDEIKGDKQPISFHSDIKPFRNHTIKLDAKARFFLQSDGFIDQFGGPRNKKFMAKNLKSAILDTLEKDVKDQVGELEIQLIKWIGNEEQTDDICLLIIEI